MRFDWSARTHGKLAITASTTPTKLASNADVLGATL